MRTFLLVQALFLSAFGIAYAVRPAETDLEFLTAAGHERLPDVVVPRREPLTVAPLFDRADLPDLFSDEQIAMVLKRVRPVFDRKELRPNLVEHALRTWGVDATFADPKALSGAEMADFLTDNGKYIASWGPKEESLIEEKPEGFAIRWGRHNSSSVHHDHWLASLSEAGATLDTPVFGKSRRGDLEGVLRESLRDFRLDEREVEWTAMAFGLWLPPTNAWIGSGGRHYSFDLIADRLIRGQNERGVCSGTHRVYSLVLLTRLDDQFDTVLSDDMRSAVDKHLIGVRDSIAASQFPDGHWPGNWPDGADAVKTPREDPLSTKIIATGHHLEWQAIAPAHLRLSDEQNRRAAQWLAETIGSQKDEEILKNYTFCTHVGNAFALWRKTTPAAYWREWNETHPGYELALDPAQVVIETPAAPSRSDEG